MSITATEFNVDPFSKAIPGQSLTDELGGRPYEKPPSVTSPKEAMDNIVQSLEEEPSRTEFLKLLDAGLSAETVASAIVLKMFSEGVITPDVAEILKPALVGYITKEAVDAGIEGINVVNELPKEGMDAMDHSMLMEKVNPQKHARIRQEDSEEIAGDKLMDMIDFPEESEEEMSEEDTQESRDSFLDMEVA